MEETEPTPPTGEPTPEEIKKALKAFKKRLKLTRLDDESKLGGGAMTGGRTSAIVGIKLPSQIRQEVWDVLIAKGRLRRIGPGQYELVKV